MINDITNNSNNSWLDTIGQAVGIYSDYENGRTRAEADKIRAQGEYANSQLQYAIAQSQLDKSKIITLTIAIFGGLIAIIAIKYILKRK